MQTIKNAQYRQPLGGTLSSERSRFKALLAVSSLHFLNDLHPTLLPALLPKIVEKLSLSMGQAGFLSTVFGLLNLLIQPFAGQIADKMNRPLLALYAPLMTAAGAYLLPVAPTYGAALLFVSLLGIGTASFHPQGHGLTGIVGGNEKLGSYLAIFAAAGTLGSAVSPLYAVGLLNVLGEKRMPLALLMVGAVILVVRRWIPAVTHDREQHGPDSYTSLGSGKAERPGMVAVLKVCMSLIVISIVRDSTFQGIRVFLPLLITGLGGSMGDGAKALFAYTLAGSAANLAGGRLADKFGKMRLVLIMLFLAPLFMFPAIQSGGTTQIVLFICAGACISATNPVTLAMAQERMPGARSTASSLVMGVSWGIANIVAYPIGRIADNVGLSMTLSFVALAPLSLVACFALRALAARDTTAPKL